MTEIGHSEPNGTNHTLVIPLQINGEEVTTQTTYKVINPVTNTVAWESSSASKADAQKAAESAQAAFPAWSKTKVSVRRNLLLKAADIFARRAEELAEIEKVETGGEIEFSSWLAALTIEQLQDVAGRVSQIVGQVPILEKEGTSAMVVKEPYGVIFSISPWNAPYYLGVRSISYALAAGNTVVLKGSEFCPRCYWAIGSVFKEAGLPDGVLNVISHRPQDAAEITIAVIEHPAVKKINFTGSSGVGSIIAAAAGMHLKPVLLELGGKASAIVLQDADLEIAAENCVRGAFAHSGQVCMSTERVLVHSSIAEPFSQALKSASAKIYPENAPSLILIGPVGVEKNKKNIAQALSKGASVLVGNPDIEESSNTRMRPIIVEKVRPDMDLYYQESFGPSTSLITFDSEEEAIRIANDTEYGLSSAVFTTNLATGFRVAKQIETGAVHINRSTVFEDVNLPFGGAKHSGFGRFNTNAGLEEFLRTKNITWVD